MRECILQCACLDFPLLWSFSLEVWLAVVQSQVLSFLCVCVNLLSLGGGLLKGSMYNETLSLLQYVHVFVSSVHLLFQWPDWLSPRSEGLAHYHHITTGPHPQLACYTFIVIWQTDCLYQIISFSVYVRAPQPSCCKNTFLLMTTKPNCQLKIKQNKHSINWIKG